MSEHQEHQRGTSSGRKKPRSASSERKKQDYTALIQSRTSKIAAGKPHWNGLLSWSSDCPDCPLMYFSADYALIGKERSTENSADISWSVQPDAMATDRRKKLMQQANDFINDEEPEEALSLLLELAKCISYRLNENEFTALISTAEMAIRNYLRNSRQMTMKDISHAIGFVKANVHRASVAPGQAPAEEEVNASKEEFCSLLLTLVDIIQSIRHQRNLDSLSLCSDSLSALDMSEVEEIDIEETRSSKSSSEKPAMSDRFNLYLTFFSLLIQSAFIEAGFVSGNVYINRLVGNAEEAYYMTHDSKDKITTFMKPLGAYIYGRLWCETGDDEGHGAYFLSDYYEKHGAEFETMLQSSDKDKLHSTYLCNMRRIRQTVQKYDHLL